MTDARFDPLAAVRRTRERLEDRFTRASAGGDRWLAECRDLFDALAPDAGVYFVACADAAAVDALADRCPPDSPHDRILGVFDLCRPLVGQDWPTGVRPTPRTTGFWVCSTFAGRWSDRAAD